MRFSQTLSFRLFVGLLLLLLSTFCLYSYVTVRIFTSRMQAQVYQSAYRVSDLIKSSTYYSMLLNRKQDVYQIITTIGREPGVEGIRIYNKRGVITFSTDKKEEGTMVDLHAEACFVCHERQKPLQALPIPNRMRVYQGAGGYRLVGLINPIRNEEGCAGPACHAQPRERTVLGVLDVRMSLQQVDQSIAEVQRRTVLNAVLILLGTALLAGLYVLLTIRRPVSRLMRGTRQISAGNLDYQIPVTGSDELGQLAGAFNEMTTSLKRARQENEEWASTLEDRVREKTEQLQRIHGQIAQIEKMASLGKLAASVAHELNNPLAGILAYAKLVARRLRTGPLSPEKTQETLEDLALIARETERCGNIVKNLLLFSRKQTSEVGVVRARDVVDKSVKLIAHHLEISKVEPQVSFRPEDASFIGDENQLQQALVAIMVNAVEAMPEGGTLRVEVSQERHDADVRIRISDTGVGIRQDDLPHIFEPFFSTKKEGKGTGLGLSIAYGIVERHGGDIEVESSPRNGTTFTLRLPHSGMGGTTT
ncbi:MAG: HAMP domain-containing protein [Candidatus Eisenbacteria bacterium]|nr:HAMP domain-containing protein [Candidatus Eisenbacteria bacterium]